MTGTPRVTAAAMVRAELAELSARVTDLERTTGDDRGLHRAVERIATRLELLVEVSDAVHDAVVDRLDRMEAELAELRHMRASTASTGSPVADDPQSGRSGSYDETVAAARSLVAQLTPPGATVAIVSKGDPSLVDLDGRVGWHFPRQEDGRYLGYYPRDGADAVTMLEAVRGAGAEYLAFPTTSLWWLSHYGELRHHLHQHHTAVVDDPAMALFRLAPSRSTADTAPRVGHDVDQVRDLVDRLVPAEEPVAVVAADPERYRSWGRAIVTLPLLDDVAGARSAVEALRADGVRHIVVPHAPQHATTATELHLARCARTIIDQASVCALLMITDRDVDATTPSEHAATSTPQENRP